MTFCQVKVSPKYELVTEKSYIGKQEPCILRTPLPAPATDGAKKNKGNPDKPNQRKEDAIREDLARFMENRPSRMKSKVSGLRTRWEGLPGVNDDGTLIPRWQIKESSLIRSLLKQQKKEISLLRSILGIKLISQSSILFISN